MSKRARNTFYKEQKAYNAMLASYYYKLDHEALEGPTLDKVRGFLADNGLELDFSYDPCTDTHGLYDPHVSITAKMYGASHEFKLEDY